jgi:hypothetical protein
MTCLRQVISLLIYLSFWLLDLFVYHTGGPDRMSLNSLNVFEMTIPICYRGRRGCVGSRGPASVGSIITHVGAFCIPGCSSLLDLRRPSSVLLAVLRHPVPSPPAAKFLAIAR